MPAAPARVRVPLADRWLGALFARWPGLGRRLADWETRAAELDAPLPAVSRPVYVCGLARSGSTLLLQTLADAPGFTTHRYADFPLLYTPLWWNRLRARLPQAAGVARERAHGDRLAVTRESPEAFEEVFWQAAFPRRHDAAVDQVLEAADRDAAFDAFYRAHVGKLLRARGATRYLAKANYHLTRLGYLHALFPDARFVIPVRDPVAHVESLVRQDRRFVELAAADPSIAAHLHRAGHYEFGPGKRAIHLGDDDEARAIQADFDAGRTVSGYARQWNALHRWLSARLSADRALADACVLVPYERLCASPETMLAELFARVGIDADAATALIARHAPAISAPTYYDTAFSSEDAAQVRRITAPGLAAMQALIGAEGFRRL